MRGWIKAALGLGAASSAVGVGFLVNGNFAKSPTIEIPEAPKREKSHELFESRFSGKKMITRDNWDAWMKKVKDHKGKPYWPNSLSVLTEASRPDSDLASMLQSICFNIDDGSGKIKDDASLKKNFEPKNGGHESVNLEDVAFKLCGVE